MAYVVHHPPARQLPDLVSPELLSDIHGPDSERSRRVRNQYDDRGWVQLKPGDTMRVTNYGVSTTIIYPPEGRGHEVLAEQKIDLLATDEPVDASMLRIAVLRCQGTPHVVVYNSVSKPGGQDGERLDFIRNVVGRGGGKMSFTPDWLMNEPGRVRSDELQDIYLMLDGLKDNPHIAGKIAPSMEINVSDNPNKYGQTYSIELTPKGWGVKCYEGTGSDRFLSRSSSTTGYLVLDHNAADIKRKVEEAFPGMEFNDKYKLVPKTRTPL